MDEFPNANVFASIEKSYWTRFVDRKFPRNSFLRPAISEDKLVEGLEKAWRVNRAEMRLALLLSTLCFYLISGQAVEVKSFFVSISDVRPFLDALVLLIGFTLFAASLSRKAVGYQAA